MSYYFRFTFWWYYLFMVIQCLQTHFLIGTRQANVPSMDTNSVGAIVLWPLSDKRQLKRLSMESGVMLNTKNNLRIHPINRNPIQIIFLQVRGC